METSLIIQQKPEGEVLTNVELIADFVTEKLKEFDPATYNGDIARAKDARAELNKSAGFINLGRKQMEEEMRKPWKPVIDKLKDIETDIKTASGNIDTVIKVREENERADKKKAIEAYWKCTNFKLCELDKIMDKKWLNKTVRITAIKKYIDTLQQKILTDVKIIEKIDESPETIEHMKSSYLESLNLSEVFAEEDRLIENRKLLEVEKEQRQQRELSQQQCEITREEVKEEHHDIISNLAEAAMAEQDETPVIPHNPDDDIFEYTLSFTGRRADLLAMRQFMTDNHITYKKIEIEIK
jgi:hypothetical protein